MADDTHGASAPTLLERFSPKSSPRVQVAGAAVMWTVGASILIVRGIGYLRDEHWALWLIALAVILGVAKSRVLLDRVARKAVARIDERGRACFFGFFSVKSWLFVGAMMGGGILLRNSGLPHGVLSVIYLGVGTALVLADRIFWRALLFPRRPVAVEPAEAAAK
jgi:hypothetical protein